MAKFSNKPTKKIYPQGPTATAAQPTQYTHEGGLGYAKDDKTALYTLAVTNMVGESTFYESAEDRDDRFKNLVHRVTAADPEWISHFITFLREEANMRSASIVVAAEAAKTLIYLRSQGYEIEGNVRSIISSACSRADEPAEMLGYWLSTEGRKIPAGVKRGIADAAQRLYNEYTALKYDGQSRKIRMGDVLNLTHPRPQDATQADLFGYIMDRRYGRDEAVPESLHKLSLAKQWDTLPEEQRRDALRTQGRQVLADAGYTWERLSGWLPGGMDAEAWEAIIPSMGYMALLRNIRNFETTGVSKETLTKVAEKLADPEEVARSRQFPYRFWSAWKASGTMFFGPALEAALDLSVKNIPTFDGRTLVAVDTSGSMNSPVSDGSRVLCFEIAALFGSAVAQQSGADMIMYADTWRPFEVQASVLRTVEALAQRIGEIGYGTRTWPSVNEAFGRGDYDRICVFTDMQDHPNRPINYRNAVQLPDVPIYVWDLRGYATANVPNTDGRYLFGGFTDSAFKLISLLEAGRDANWPWEH